MKNFDLGALNLQNVDRNSLARSLSEHSAGITLESAAKLNQAVDPATAVFHGYGATTNKGHAI